MRLQKLLPSVVISILFNSVVIIMKLDEHVTLKKKNNQSVYYQIKTQKILLNFTLTEEVL